MRDVIIVGGGLSGLSVAYEFEQLKVPYTLIEVKKRLGGSIITERREGFIVDGGIMAVPRDGDWSLLEELGLAGALIPIGGDQSIFKDGAQSLVDALTARLTGAIMLRMAVSSVGRVGCCFGVCLENGLLLEARAVVVAAPARYAAHMLYNLEPRIAECLTDYHYDTLVRLSLGYRSEDISLPPVLPPDMAFAFCHWTDSPRRAPPGHVLAQLGLRVKLDSDPPDGWVATVLEELNWPTNPVMAAAHIWPEADPLTCHDTSHGETMAKIERLLPDGAALVGSDYRAGSLAGRASEGRNAARRIAAWLRRAA